MRYRVVAVVLLVLVIRTVTSAARDLTEDAEVSSNFSLIEAWLEARIAYEDLPGISIGVVYDQELVYARGFGYANTSEVVSATEETAYRIASHTKMFTAIAVMQLIERGKLTLQDPVSKYLDWFRIASDKDSAPSVTIHQLLTHTSGLPAEAGSAYWWTGEFPELSEVIREAAPITLVYPPGTRWKYSNLGYVLLGEVVATSSGQPYQEYVRQHILKPLGMTATYFVRDAGQRSTAAMGYSRKLPGSSRRTLPPVPANGISAAGGLSSSVSDLAKFVSWQFRLRAGEGEEILRAATLRRMQRVHWLQAHWTSGWGLGFDVQHTEKRDLVGHGGLFPGYQSATYISPEEKVGVIVLTNSLDARPYVGLPDSIIQRIFEWIAPAIHHALKRDSPSTLNSAWSPYVGLYRDLYQDFLVLELDGTLTILDPTALDPKQGPLTLVPIADNRFEIQGLGFGSIGETVRFELGPDGKAVRMKMGREESIAERIAY